MDDCMRSSPQGLEWCKRDVLHANEHGKQLAAQIFQRWISSDGP